MPVLIGIVLLGSLLLLYDAHHKIEKSKRLLRAFVLQDDLDPDHKYNHSRPEEYARMLRMIPQIDLAIFPESTLSLEVDTLPKAIQERFASFSHPVWAGAYLEAEHGLYNGVVDLQNRQTLYKKVRIIAFGEYIPKWIESWLPYLPSFATNKMAAATIQPPVPFEGLRAAVTICYEILFSDLVRKSAKEANFLVNLSDLAWLKSKEVLAYMVDIAHIRAMEHAKPMVVSSNGGYSLCLDGTGRFVDM